MLLLNFSQGNIFSAGYVESLEKEITELKSKNRALKQQVEEKPRSAQPGRGTQISVHGGQPQDQFIQAHIRELNGTIGKDLTVLKVGNTRQQFAGQLVLSSWSSGKNQKAGSEKQREFNH